MCDLELLQTDCGWDVIYVSDAYHVDGLPVKFVFAHLFYDLDQNLQIEIDKAKGGYLPAWVIQQLAVEISKL